MTTRPSDAGPTAARASGRRHKRPRPERIGIITVYFVASAVSLFLGLHLKNQGFRTEPPPGQIYAVVFTRQSDASVSLLSSIYPRRPWLDRVKIDATVSPGRQVPWLLVLQCPHEPQSAAHAAELYSQTGGQRPVSPQPVAVYSHTGPFTVQYRCFTSVGRSARDGHSIANVALPALGTDAAIAASTQPPTVYTERNMRTGRLAVMQVFPDLVCPSPSIALQRASTGCRSQAAAHSVLSAYHTPIGVQTTEVLSGVNFTNFQLESVFPAPVRQAAGSNETFTWSQSSAVIPSLQVADSGQQHTQSEDTFYAGVFFGIFGAAVVAFVERLWSTWFAEDEPMTAVVPV